MHVMAIATDGLTDELQLLNCFLRICNIDVCFWHFPKSTQDFGLSANTKTSLDIPSLRNHGYRSEEIQPEPWVSAYQDRMGDLTNFTDTMLRVKDPQKSSKAIAVFRPPF